MFLRDAEGLATLAAADEFPAASLPSGISPLSDARIPWSQLEPTAARRYAVLLLFMPPQTLSDPARLVLTRRSTRVRSHRGQISLAGGKADADDATPAATALREAEEELGLSRQRIMVVGMLKPTTALDGAPVYPVVAGTLAHTEELRPEPAEVETVYAEPWVLYAQGRSRAFAFNVFGNWRQSRLFEGGRYPVWGLTAQILHEAALRA